MCGGLAGAGLRAHPTSPRVAFEATRSAAAFLGPRGAQPAPGQQGGSSAGNHFAFADEPWTAERVPVPIPVPVYVPVPMHMYSQSVPVPTTLPVPVSHPGCVGGCGESALFHLEAGAGAPRGAVSVGWGRGQQTSASAFHARLLCPSSVEKGVPEAVSLRTEAR